MTIRSNRYPIPTTWSWARLGDLGRWRGGGTPSKANPRFWTNGTIPWVSPKDMKRDRIADAEDHITKEAVEQSATSVLDPGSVLVVTRSGILERILPVAVAERPVALNQDLKAVTPVVGLDPTYLAFALRRFEREILHECSKSGTTVASIEFGRLLDFEVPVAPPDEQRRIVAEIDKQLTRLDAGVGALKRLQVHLRRYRAAVLKAACEGRLVPTEADLARSSGRNFQTGEGLLAQILAARPQAWDGWAKRTGKKRTRYVSPQHVSGPDLPTLPEGWCWATWDQVGFSQNGRAFPSGDYADEGVRLLRPGNLHVSGRMVWTEENERRLPQKYAEEFPEFLIRAGELVMNLTAQSLKDEFLGRICMTGPEEREDPCLLNQRQARLSPMLVSSRYLFWTLKSPLFRRFVDGLNTGSLIQHMFTSQLAEFALPLPPLPEQERIVAEVERHFSVVEQAEAAVRHGLARGRALRTAILKAAFEGHLVEQKFSGKPAAVPVSRTVTSRTAPSKPVRSRNRASASGA